MGEGNLAEVYTVGLKLLNTDSSMVPIKLGLGELITHGELGHEGNWTEASGSSELTRGT